MLNLLSSIFIKDTYCFTQLIVNQVYTPVSLILYSHIPTALVTIFVGVFLFTRSKSLETKIFFFLSIIFFLFTLGDLVEWFVFFGRNTVLFARSMIEILDIMLFLFSFYFLFVLIKKRDVRFIYKSLWLLPALSFVGVLIFFISKNTLSYNWQICEVSENGFVGTYGYYVDVFYLLSAIIFAVWSIIKNKNNRREISIISAGVLSFMILFFVMEYVFTGYILGGVFDYNYFLYALFGMPILIGFLAYLIVEYKTFNIKLLATQVLVWGLGALIGAQFFFATSTENYILIAITFIVSIIFGDILIKAIKKEVKQKEELAALNIDLSKLIQQRESLVHLITHKVKGSFTHTKYIFAGILDGMYGEPSDALKKVAKYGLDSDDNGVKTVDLILNASNLQKGTVKFDLKPINFKDLVTSVVDEKKERFEEKGLKLNVDIKEDEYKVNGDAFWLREVVNNLIENALRYTKEGTVNVSLNKELARDDGNNKMIFSVKDSGVGITPEDRKNLFMEGGRGKDSVKVNVDSTGYGLFTVKLIIEAHSGKVWVDSEGENKGSTFFVELDSV